MKLSKHGDHDDKRDCGWHSRFSPLAIVGMVIGGIALAVLFAFLFGWVVMLLWNWLMPEIFGLPAITYWQGWGLVLLSHILLKGSFHGEGDHHGRGKKHGKKRSWEQECEKGWREVKEEIAKEVNREEACGADKEENAKGDSAVKAD